MASFHTKTIGNKLTGNGCIGYPSSNEKIMLF